MLKSLTHEWDIHKSPLYRHMKTKRVKKEFSSKICKTIIRTLHEDKDMDFLQGSKEIQDLLEEINTD